MTVTEAGAAVLPFARDALAAVGGARSAVEEVMGLLRGHVRVGMVTAGPAVTMTGLLDGFHRAHPEVEITLTGYQTRPRCWPRSATGRSTSPARRSGPSRPRASRRR